MRRFLHALGGLWNASHKVQAGVLILAFFILVAILHPQINAIIGHGQDPLAVSTASAWQLPNSQHWLGTDRYGRDILAMTVTALTASLEVGVAQQANDAQANDATDESAQPNNDSSGGARSVFGDVPPVDVRGALPSKAAANAGKEGLASGLATGAGDFHRGGPKGPAKIGQGLARTGVYGIEAEGHSFVYVFDRSDSMGVGGGSPLASAKAQLIASLDDPTEQNQFHIIFYNTTPHTMDLGRRFGGLVFADEWAKAQAKKHVQSITASGGTDHFAALQAGLRLHPDVIFFLTDADQPGLTRPQFEQINRLNSGRTSIHTIEFGDHPHSSRENFLGRIARENGGKHVYIDITKQGALQ